MKLYAIVGIIIILMCFREFLEFFGEFWHFLDLQQKGHFLKICRTHFQYLGIITTITKKNDLHFLNYFQMNICRVVHCALIANPAFSLLQCSPLTQTTIFSSEEKRTAKGLRTTTRLGFSLV